MHTRHSYKHGVPFILIATMAFACAQNVSGQQPDQPQANTVATIPDAQIEANVLKALAGSPQLTGQSVSTTTVYGVVTLSGTVRDEAARTAAETLASNAAGVKKVVDELTIGVPAATPPDTSTPPDDVQPPDSAQVQDDQQNGSNPNLQSDGTMAPPQSPMPGNPQQPGPPVAPNDTGPQQPSPDGGWAGDRPLPGESQQPPSYETRQRGEYGPPNEGYRQNEPPQPPRPPQQAGQPVVVPAGTMLRIRIDQGMDSQHAQAGATFNGVVLNDVEVGQFIAIPRGASVLGTVVNAQGSGALKGKGVLALQLTQLNLSGNAYPIVTDTWSHQGESKTPQTVSNAVGLGAVGALIGAVAGGGGGALLGAGIGGAAGLGASAASGQGKVFIPAEAILTFHLTQPTHLATVSDQEIQSLAANTPALGNPSQLRRRRPPPYPYYGPAYYRPYPYYGYPRPPYPY